MSGFVDNEVEEASDDDQVSEGDDEVEQNRSKKKAGKNRSRVIDSSDEDEDDGEYRVSHVLSPHPLSSQTRIN